MHLLKIWPVLISMVVCGCSLQHHTDRAERTWLTSGSLHAPLHNVRLKAADPGNSPEQQSFYSAAAAATILRGKIQSPQIRELSGIAAILGEEDKYWAINDSGNRPQLFALDGNGEHLGVINLPLRNRDWEDLSTYRYKEQNWIAIAETGDNLQRYPRSHIYLFKQPDINNLPPQLKPAHQINFTYPDGAQNVEAMAVSVAEDSIYLIAKDTSEPTIYTLPLAVVHEDSASNLVAGKVGQMAELYPTKKDVWWERRFAAHILYDATAADISADNRTAVVANYRHVYLFKRHDGETWASAFSRQPEVLSSHRMQQSEALAFSADSSEVMVSSEGQNALLLSIHQTGGTDPASREDKTKAVSVWW